MPAAAAYEAHIKSPHFLKYKTSTEKMVRSLRLVDTDADPAVRKVERPGGRPDDLPVTIGRAALTIAW